MNEYELRQNDVIDFWFGVRDDKMRELWVAYKTIYDLVGDVSDIDAEIWSKITMHPAVSKSLTIKE